MTIGINLPGPWLDLREAAISEQSVLSETIFEKARQVFVRFYAANDRALASLTPEYRHEEFLMVVDGQGSASGASPGMLAAHREMIAAQPAFGEWFQEAILPEGGQVLLAARWLCHLIGLRHRTVEIFIDPPHLDGHTLVQVRGMDKYEAPGAFDIPCAGHIGGVDLAEEALKKELAEELGLSPDDLSETRWVACYNSRPEEHEGKSLNSEYRFLYRACLKEKSAKRIRFADGEVAGLAVFSVAELRTMVERFPERVASGLSGAVGFYR